uniref:Gypsy retrotransposon integrase-like protein 1 n=1 Tax=Latimeria chalumnae TaxID=7897 RepID=H3B3I4_LATCH
YRMHIFALQSLPATETREDHLTLLDELLKLLTAVGLKVDIVCRLPLPSSCATLRSFLDLVSRSRDFIPGFVELAKPLYSLLKKGAEWKWKECHTEAVSTLKQRLMMAPALMNPDPTRPFHLEIMATEVAMAAVLAQERHYVKRPIVYVSRALTAVEQKYTQCEKNLLATFWVVKHFTYIAGLNPIILHASHTPTEFLLSDCIKDGGASNARLMHWSLQLQDRDITVQRSCSPSLLAHSLLCEGEPHECPAPDTESDFKPLFLPAPDNLDELIAEQYFKEPGQLEWGSVTRSCTPHSAQYAELAAFACALDSVGRRKEMIYSVHDTPTGGHQGEEKTYEKMQTVGWWPRVSRDVRDYCNNCLICVQNNPSPNKKTAFLHPQRAGGPWARLQVDFVGP